MRRPVRGTALLVILLLAFLALRHGRQLFPTEGPPAFFMEEGRGVAVMLGAGFPRPGVYQFSDGCALLDVMKLTGLQLAPSLVPEIDPHRPLISGEKLDVVRKGNKVVEIRVNFLPARQRMALGILLHPDRMTREDWEALPGIGPKLAERIEVDRQKYGDFGSLEGLLRVRGIGRKRIEEWKGYFYSAKTH